MYFFCAIKLKEIYKSCPRKKERIRFITMNNIFRNVSMSNQDVHIDDIIIGGKVHVKNAMNLPPPPPCNIENISWNGATKDTV